MFYNGKTTDFFSGKFLNEVAGNSKMVHPHASASDILLDIKKHFDLDISSEMLVYEIQAVGNELYITFSNDFMWYECYYELQHHEVLGYIIEPLVV